MIPVGGSNGTGAAGYVNAMLELDLQIKNMGIEPDAIVFATSSGGTPELFTWSEQCQNCYSCF